MGTERALKEYGREPVPTGTYIRGTLTIAECFKRIGDVDTEAGVMF